MDYIVQDEEILLALAGEAGLKPDAVMQARRLLSPSEFPD